MAPSGTASRKPATTKNISEFKKTISPVMMMIWARLPETIFFIKTQYQFYSNTLR